MHECTVEATEEIICEWKCYFSNIITCSDFLEIHMILKEHAPESILSPASSLPTPGLSLQDPWSPEYAEYYY